MIVHRLIAAANRPAWLLLVPALLLEVLYRGAYVDVAIYRGYRLGIVSNSAIFLVFSCAVAAASAAIEGSRVRRSRVDGAPVVRSRARLLVDRLWPSAVAGAIVQFAGLMLIGRSTWGAPGGVPAILPLSLVAAILFHAAAGYFCGRFLPRAVGVAAAVVFSYCWLGFAWAVGYWPLHYLAGLVMTDCCTLDSTLDPSAPLALLSFSVVATAALVLASTVAASRRRKHKAITAGSALVIAAIAIVTGVTVAGDIGPSPVRPRPHSQATCRGVSPTVCTYPEQTGVGDPSAVLRAAWKNLDAAGLTVPTTIRFGAHDTTRGTSYLAAAVGMTPQQIVYSYSTSFVPTSGAPYCGDEADYERRSTAAALVQAFYQRVAGEGIVDSDWGIGGLPTADDEKAQLAALPVKAQVQWVDEVTPALHGCRAPVPELPHP